jgi:hypothetical protein
LTGQAGGYVALSCRVPVHNFRSYLDDDSVEVWDIMRAFDPEVVDVIWRTVEPLLPVPAETHPLGCHGLGCLIECASGAS